MILWPLCADVADTTPHFDLLAGEFGRRPRTAVFLYPADDAVYDEWVDDGPVAAAVVDGLDQFVDYGALGGYAAFTLAASEPFVADDAGAEYADTTKAAFVDAFEAYTERHPELCGARGLHYGVAGGFDGGGGFSADELDELAFSTNCRMVVGTASEDAARVEAFTKQELGHALIGYRHLAKTSVLVERGSHMHEHDTGVVYPSGEVSPMAVTYHDSHAAHGACANGDLHFRGYNPNYTDCTKIAVRRTAEAVFGGEG